MEEVCLKECVLFANIRSVQDPLPLKEEFPFTRLMKFLLFINDNLTGCDMSQLKSPKAILLS